MFSLNSLREAAPNRPLHRALLLGGGLLVLFLVLQFLPASAPEAARPTASGSADDAGTVAVAPDPPVSFGVNLFSIGNVAAALLLLGGGALALYLQQRPPQPADASAPIRPLAQLPLAQGQQLRLVACGGEVLLLGVTADQVTLLKTFPRVAFADHPALSPEAEAEVQRSSSEPPGFSDVLRRFAQHVAQA